RRRRVSASHDGRRWEGSSARLRLSQAKPGIGATAAMHCTTRPGETPERESGAKLIARPPHGLCARGAKLAARTEHPLCARRVTNIGSIRRDTSNLLRATHDKRRAFRREITPNLP